jgi:hypothetical protein
MARNWQDSIFCKYLDFFTRGYAISSQETGVDLEGSGNSVSVEHVCLTNHVSLNHTESKCVAFRVSGT